MSRALGTTQFTGAPLTKRRHDTPESVAAWLKRERSAGYDPRNTVNAVFVRDRVQADLQRRHREANETARKILSPAYDEIEARVMASVMAKPELQHIYSLMATLGAEYASGPVIGYDEIWNGARYSK